MIDERKLIERAINGKEKAFETLMNSYLQDIYNFINFQVENRDDVKDILQEVMLGAYNNLKTFDHNASLKTWLLSITKRKIADYYREQYAKKTIMIEPIENHENMIDYESQIPFSNLSIMDIIKNLSDDEKDLVHLFFIQQLTYQEVSTLMNIPVGTVKSHMYYIREKLKNVLKEENDEL